VKAGGAKETIDLDARGRKKFVGKEDGKAGLRVKRRLNKT